MRLHGLLSLVLLTCGPLFGGGAWISFADPAVADPSATGALTTIRLIRPDGIGLDTVEVTGTAEGVVKGHRVSLPVVIEHSSGQGVRAIRWERPAEGQWVLAFTIRNGLNASGASAVVRVRSNRVCPQRVPLNLGSGWTTTLIEAAFTGTVPAAATVLPPGAWRNPQ